MKDASGVMVSAWMFYVKRCMLESLLVQLKFSFYVKDYSLRRSLVEFRKSELFLSLFQVCNTGNIMADISCVQLESVVVPIYKSNI